MFDFVVVFLLPFGAVVINNLTNGSGVSTATEKTSVNDPLIHSVCQSVSPSVS